MSFLERILAEKRREVEERSRSVPLKDLEARAGLAPAVRSLKRALRPGGPPGPGAHGAEKPRVLAEVKKASPSKGVIREDFDPVGIARAYERAGAAAISVLTDGPFFQGSLDHLRAIREAVALPLLRKDFIVDPYQVWESRAAGADAILLILAAVPDDNRMADLAREARELGLEILWEVHDAGDLRRAIALGPEIIGINNRSLRTFEVSLETTRSLLPGIPPGVVKVSESGFARREEIETMRGWGVDAFLIGESLMRAPDPGAALGMLLEPPKEVRP